MIATEPTTHTVAVPGAAITYDVRPNPASTLPALVLIGSPMGAGGFVTLASHFQDRTVVTYDPRGVERSTRTDDGVSTPDLNADDLHAVLADLGIHGVDLFGSSGGAATGLAMVARHPSDVRLLIAHEPPLASQVPDREPELAAVRAMGKTYQEHGWGPAMAQFISLVSMKGEIPADFASQPAPDPAMFGLPTADDGSRTDVMFAQNLVGNTHYEPDYAALRAAPTRIVIAVGEESEGELARRGGEAVAKRLGVTPVVFPSGHSGFLGGEYGQTGKPDEFAAKLREVLAG